MITSNNEDITIAVIISSIFNVGFFTVKVIFTLEVIRWWLIFRGYM